MTKEDLQQIGELLKAEREHTRKIVQEVVEVNNRVLSTIFRVELAETNKRIDANAQNMKALKQDTEALKQGQEGIEQRLDKLPEDHEERITRLEEGADLTHKN